MAPVIPIIGAVIGAVGAIVSTSMANKQAERASQRQADYQKQLLAQQQATEAAQKQKAQEAVERNKSYGQSLLDGNSQLGNILTDSWSDLETETDSTLIMGNTLLSGTEAQQQPSEAITPNEMFA